MADDEIEAAIGDYQRLQTEWDGLNNEMTAIGRTDVPLSDPLHVRHATAKAQSDWWDLFERRTLIEPKRDAAWRRVVSLLRRARPGGS